MLPKPADSGRPQPSAAFPLSEDLRRSTRVSVHLTVECKAKGTHTWTRGIIHDISQHGIKMTLQNELNFSKGTVLELIIFFESGKPWEVSGEITWAQAQSHEVSCGVDFNQAHQISRKDAIIYFLADKICATARQFLPASKCHPVQNVSESIAAYRLLYHEYLKRGYCKENEEKLFYNYHALLPSSRTFVYPSNQKDTILGTLSLIPDSACQLPMDVLFHDEMACFRKPGRLLAEVGLLANATEKKRFSLTDYNKLLAAFSLFKLMFDYACFIGVTDLMITVHPKHEDLYRYLKFETIGRVKPYPGVCGNLALPLRMDIQKILQETPKNYGVGSFFLNYKTPQSILESGYRPESREIKELLKNRLQLWDQLPPTVQAHFRQLYPQLA